MNVFYEPPKRIVPKLHQQETLEFLLAHKRCYNLSDMGTGKTLPAVQAIQLLYANTNTRRILVVAPLSVIRATWQDHFEQFAPELPLLLLDEATKRRKQTDVLVDEYGKWDGVLIINPDGVKTIFHELVEWKPNLIVIDELSGYYRNMRTDRWKAMHLLDYKCQAAMWAFTGTPITKNLMDSYAQCMLVNPKALPKTGSGKAISYVNMRDMLHTQPYPNTWIPKKGALERVQGFMQPAKRYTRDQVMKDVKEAVRLRKEIPLTPEQKRLMDELKEKGKTVHGDSVISVAQLSALVTKVTQIATGSVYDSAGNAASIPAAPRLNAMFDLYDEIGQTPLIVCVPFIHTAHKLKEEITRRGHTCEIIIGDVKIAERAEVVRRFQNGEIDFLVCHPKTMAHGITLTRSSTVLWYAPLYDLELYAQANARIERYGQEGQPLVVEFCATPIEAKIYAALRGKEKLAGKFLELFA